PPPVPALQIICGDAEGDVGGIQGSLQPALLLHQQLGLGLHIPDLPGQLRLPEVNIQQPLPQALGTVRLGTLGPGFCLRYKLLGLMPPCLRLVPVREGPVEGGQVALLPFFMQVLGCTEAGSGQTGGGVRARVLRHLRRLHRKYLPLPHQTFPACPPPS
uniref:Uncharacterized protein n=1 Tax=Xenopus tropicalis TaxID=8364 RepID=A0A6I8QQ23_XENTR